MGPVLRRRSSALALPLALAFVAVAALLPAPAAAHGGAGELTVTSLEQVGDRTVRLEVGIVYANDGHLAEEASVTATFAGPGGARVGPVDLTRTGDTTSLYAATIEVPAPGEWSTLISSTGPDGQASGSVTVDDEFAAPSAPSTIPEPIRPGGPDGSDPTTPVDPTTAPSPDDGAPSDELAEDTDGSAADTEGGAANSGSGSAIPLLVGATVLAAIVAGAGTVLARRRKDRAGSAE